MLLDYAGSPEQIQSAKQKKLTYKHNCKADTTLKKDNFARNTGQEQIKVGP